MDKYEYEIKTEQIVKLIGREDYKTAKQIADTMNWSREKDSRLLCSVAELYVQSGDYEEAIDLLLQAYENAKTGRRIVYRLVQVAILAKKYKEADSYCEEFHQLSPRDEDYYLLKYQVAEASKSVPVPHRIKMLEKYLEDNMQEEWMLRLAELYSEAGRVTECVKTCDEIIFWYCNGDYVIAAMELKMKYAPLTPKQQEKYDCREALKAAYLEELERQQNAEKQARLAKENAAQEAAEKKLREQEEAEKQEMPRNADLDNHNITEMMEDAESQLASQVSDMVAASVQEAAVTLEPEAEEPDASEEELFSKPAEETVVAQEEAVSEAVEEATADADDDAMFAAPTEEAAAEEVTDTVGAVTEEEAAQDWVAVPEAVAQEMEETFSAAVEAPENLEPVADELAATWEGDELEEMTRRTTIQKETAAPDEMDLHIFEEVKRMMSGATEEAEETAEPLAQMEEEYAERNEAAPEGAWDGTGEAAAKEAGEESAAERVEEAVQESVEVPVEDVQVPGEASAAVAETEDTEEALTEETVSSETESEAEDLFETVSGKLAEAVEEIEIAPEDALFAETEETEDSKEITETAEERAAAETVAQKDEPLEEEADDEPAVDFSAVIEEEVKRQLGDIEDNRKEAEEKQVTKAEEEVVSEGCFAVVSDSVSHGLAYAVELLKRTPQSESRPTKMAKTSAEKLNHSGLLISEDKVADKLLVITEAGNLSDELINELLMYFRHHPEAIVVFIDSDDGLRKLFEHRQELDEIFCLRYAYTERTLDEWFDYMQAYANELDCTITEGAEVLIREYLADLSENNELIYELLLKEIVDEAEMAANAFSLRNLLASAFNRKYDENGMLLLKERHF